MRTLILGLVFTIASAGAAGAADCMGAGSAIVLTIEDWWLARGDPFEVNLTYRFNDDKPAREAYAHLIFVTEADEKIAEGALELTAESGIPATGQAQVHLAQDTIAKLAAADHSSVSVLACTNTIEYLDGSGVIID